MVNNMEERRHNPALKIAAQRIDRLTEEIQRKDETIAKLNEECAELADTNMYLEEKIKEYEKALSAVKDNTIVIADAEPLNLIAEAERDLMMKKCKLINQINDIDGLNKLATQMYLKIDYDTDIEFESLLRAFIQTTEKIIGELKDETRSE